MTDLLIEPASITCGPEDSLEDNDHPLEAELLAAGSFLGLHVSNVDPDYFALTMAPGDVYDLQLTNLDPTFTGSIATLDASGGVIDEAASQILLINGEPTTQDPLFRVTSNGCIDYDLDITFVCAGPVDDAFEDNDVFPGTSSFPAPTDTLTITAVDQSDYYDWGTLPAGATLTIDTQFIDADGDVDVYLYDANDLPFDEDNWFVRGYSSTDNELVTWTNDTGADIDLVIEVELFSSSSVDPCVGTTYTIETTVQ